MALPVFITWEGLVPPQQRFIGRGFSLWHGILSFAYGALLTIIIAPRWFYYSKKTWIWLVGGYIVLLALNIFLVRYDYSPLVKTIEKIFPAGVYENLPAIDLSFISNTFFLFYL